MDEKNEGGNEKQVAYCAQQVLQQSGKMLCFVDRASLYNIL